jgi:hypothetical protein
MHDGVEMMLQVNAFAQTVGADQNRPFAPICCGGELCDALFALFGRQAAGDGGDLEVARFEPGAQVFGEIFGGRDKTAKENRTVTGFQQLVDQLNGLLQLGVLRAYELLGFARANVCN